MTSGTIDTFSANADSREHAGYSGILVCLLCECLAKAASLATVASRRRRSMLPPPAASRALTRAHKRPLIHPVRPCNPLLKMTPASWPTSPSEAAQQGHMLAQLWLAELYESGHGLAVDLTQGFRWMHAAAVQGHADAQYEVGLAFEHGRGTNQSYAKAFEFYHRASLQGNPLATYSVGLLYESGCGVDADPAKAIEWYAISASQDARGGLPCWRSERSFTAEFV
mmetsp:Transcript_87580/g.249068  ORF Transcript_87580/g.249068 Transcript_87580/m.249068 type:complete len:225 (+) Transcript_87580:869-1543(+)